MAYRAPTKLTSEGSALERSLLVELRRVEDAVTPTGADIRDPRGAATARPQPGEFVRVANGQPVILPHPRTSRGRAVHMLAEGASVITAVEGLVNGAARVAVVGAGLVIAVSSGDGWSVEGGAGTVTQALDTLTGGSVRGAVPYRGATTWQALPPGTAGQFLQTTGAGADPVWASARPAVTVRTSNLSASAATTNLVCTSRSVAANDWAVGSLYRLTGWFKYVHTATVTPRLNAELLLDGAVVETAVLEPWASAGTYSGRIEAVATCRSTGATGTLKGEVMFVSNSAGTPDWALHGSTTTTSHTLNTTAIRTLALRIRMQTAEASNTLTITQGYTERLS